ncbi:MAG: hypothetical protein K1X56_11190 [Flavobacteriales bacterium]|nr:hypothetical protein [Flavobacteriales bacterium]
MNRFLTLFAALMLSVASYAQTAVVPGDATTFAAVKKSGTFDYTFNGVSADAVKEAAKNYVRFFSVDVRQDKQTVLVKVKLNQNSEQERKVQIRFFKSSGITTVSFNGADYSVDDFFAKYMN